MTLTRTSAQIRTLHTKSLACIALTVLLHSPAGAHSVDKELLNVLLGNGTITQEQHAVLAAQLDEEDGHPHAPDHNTQPGEATQTSAPSGPVVTIEDLTTEHLDNRIADEVAQQIEAASPIKASHGSKGFRFETRDGNWQTNLQWRGQLRYTNPSSGDPRQLSAFDDSSQSTFEARRLRMKIGGHGFQPWLKYYFEVDLQPSRDTDDSSSSASARVIDWRADIAKWDWGGIRVGQWKIDYNRERVDSSGRQQFVERSIVNRVFTVDRQVGVQLRGHAFKNTRADLRWYVGAFTGEGRGVRGASLAFAAATTKGSCTRWSSSGCGNLDGFTSPANATEDQFKIEQAAQDFAFKWRGLSIQQELHHKEITDRLAGTKSRLTGGYFQSGYFFHNLYPSFPKPLELALRYAYVEEPNAQDLRFDNERQELTLAANWFFAGHNNKLTFDISRLRLDDDFVGRKESEGRVRFQWDVSF